MIEAEIPLSDREFARVKARIHAAAGIALSDAKRTLVVSRLSKLLRGLGFTSFDAYLDYLEAAGSAGDAQAFVNALTTNLTRFFREDHHFDHLTAYVGELLAERPRRAPDGRPRLRLWSAGCSTGQEAYTIALSLLAAYPDLKRWDFRILATDVDTSVLARAAAGIYPESELAGLTPARARLFERPGDGTIHIPAAARAVVAFRPLNLMDATWPMRGPFDAVFCRNVTIYFDRATQAAVFARLGRLIAPGGYLYVGHSENLGDGGAGFQLVGKTVYQWRAARKARDAA
ncbi:MAG TPA: chemotaxis protein [Alphaproteobacteria bacterium]|nr:chemotaxis protein [Alphaproteobacteria bacterium]